MFKLKKKVAVFIAVTLLAGVFTGCASNDGGQSSEKTSSEVQIETQSSDSESKVLRWAFAGDMVSETEGTKPLEELVADFEKEYNCTVDFVPIARDNWSDYLTKLQTMMVSGNSPDVFQNPHEGGRMADNLGINKSLNAFIDENPKLWEDYINNTYESVAYVRQVDGEIYSLPFCLQDMVLWINLDRFQEAGLEVPEENWTFEEFEEYLDILKRASDGKGWYPFGLPHDMSSYNQWLYNFDTGYFNDDYTEVIFDNDKSVELLDFFINCVQQGYSPMPDTNYDGWQQLVDGYVAMTSCGKWMLNYCEAADFYNVAAVQVPEKYQSRPKYAIYSVEVCNTTSQYELACQFCFYTVSPKFEAQWAINDSAIPARSDVQVEWPQEWDQVENIDLVQSIPENAYSLQNPVCFTELVNIWNSMFTSAMAGEVNAETACTSAAEEIRAANDKY